MEKKCCVPLTHLFNKIPTFLVENKNKIPIFLVDNKMFPKILLLPLKKCVFYRDLDPDPDCKKFQDPDPRKKIPDPQHCLFVANLFICRNFLGKSPPSIDDG